MKMEKSPNILLVDDQPRNLKLLEGVLAGLNVNLVNANSGEEALKRLQERKYAAILLDIKMPGLNGFGTAILIREQEISRNTPIIFITAYGENKELENLGFSLGAVDYIVKPFNADELRSKVGNLVSLSQKTRILEKNIRKSVLQKGQENILLIDDSHENLMVMKSILKNSGYNIFTSASHEEALALLQEKDFAILLLDVNLEGSKGREIVRFLKKKPHTGHTPILCIGSIQTASEDILAGYSYGVIDFIFSPFKPHLLKAKVFELVRKDKEKCILERQLKEIDKLSQELVLSETKLRNLNDTLEKKIEERTSALQESQMRQEHILNSVAIGLYITKAVADYRTVWISDNIENITGYPPRAFLEKAQFWVSRIHEDDRKKVFLERAGLLFSKGNNTLEYRWLCADGHYHWFMDHQLLVRDQNGTPLEIIGTWHDITESKKLEEQLRQSQKMESLGNITAGIAHDFNNILHTIVSWAEMLKPEQNETETPADCAGEIIMAANRAIEIISQMKDFSRDLDLKLETFHLNNVVREFLNLKKVSLSPNIQIDYKIKTSLDYVHADSNQIFRVVMNLCTNAIDAMGKKGGILTLSIDCVNSDPFLKASCSGLKTGSYIRLMVADTGPGMDKKTLERIFEPYFTTKKCRGGSGLGLAIALKIITQHGGTITVQSEPEKGVSFYVFLPMAQEIESKKTDQRILPQMCGRIF